MEPSLPGGLGRAPAPRELHVTQLGLAGCSHSRPTSEQWQGSPVLAEKGKVVRGHPPSVPPGKVAGVCQSLGLPIQVTNYSFSSNQLASTNISCCESSSFLVCVIKPALKVG